MNRTEILNEMRTLIDPCGFSSIAASLHNDPNIQHIISVDDMPLEELATICVEGEVEKLRQAIEEGKSHIMSLDEIKNTPNMMAFVIYLPPIYLVQITDKVWK